MEPGTTELSDRRRFVLRQLRRDRPLSHVNAAVELGPVGDDHLSCAQIAGHDGRGCELNALSGGDGALHRAVYHDTRGTNRRFESGRFADDEGGFADVDVPGQSALDREVFPAGQIAVELDGCADVGHEVVRVAVNGGVLRSIPTFPRVPCTGVTGRSRDAVLRARLYTENRWPEW